MAIVSMRTSDFAGGSSNYGYQTETSIYPTNGQLSLASSDVPANRRWMGLRFPQTPSDLTAANLRQVRLSLCGNNNTNNDALGTVYGHKHIHSASFSGPAFGDLNKDIIGRTLTDSHIKWDAIDQQPYVTFVFPEYQGPNNLEDIFREILSMPGWVPGGPITLIFKPDFVAPDYRWLAYGAETKDFQPTITLNYGETSSDPVEIDLYTSGDSTVAYSGNSGFDRGTQTLILFRSINFYHCAAGMAPDGNNTAGGLTTGGDKIRGYCPGGIYHRELDRRYGEELLMYTHEHAIADTLAGQWAGAIGATSEYFWGDINRAGSFRYDLAHPLSENQVVLLNLGPNDVMAYGAHNYVWGHGLLDPETNQEQWRDWILTNVTALMEQIIAEIYRCVEAGGNDPKKCWIFLTGYPNHCVIDKIMTNPNGTTFLPVGQSNQIFRSLWCTGDGNHNFLGFNQYAYDTGIPQNLGGNIDPRIHPDDQGGIRREWQSSVVMFMIDRQQKANPKDCIENDGDPDHKWGPQEYNPNAASWANTPTSALYSINFPVASFASYTPWTYSYGNPSQGGAKSISGWYYGFRNVTDITINRKMAILDEMNRLLDAAHPRVVFADCRNKMGVDTVCSADPTSPYAQPTADNFVEGVHLNDVGTTTWLNWPNGVLDRLVATIPVMQRLASPFEHLEPAAAVGVYLQGEWNGTDVDFAYFDHVYGGELIEPPVDPPVLDVDFAAGDATIVGTSIKKGAKSLFQLYDPSNGHATYGSANLEKEYNTAASWSLIPGQGLNVHQHAAPGIASGYNWESGFAGSREVSFYLPLFCKIVIVARLPRFVEAWPALWLRQNPGGAGVAEVDIMEGFMGQNGIVLSATLHNMFGLFGTNGHRNRLTVPNDGQFHIFQVDITQFGVDGVDIKFRMDGNSSDANFVPPTQQYNGINDFHIDSLPAMLSETPDLTQGWDLALNCAIGGKFIADPDVVYAGVLQGGTSAKPLGTNVLSWHDGGQGQQSDMTIKSIKVTAN